MKKVLFDIKYKEKIINGSAKVFYNDNPVRIICWDRNTGDGANSIVGLMKSSSCSAETIITISANGTVFIPTMGITSNCIYVHIDEDWKFDFNEGESVVCVNNNAPYELEVGGIYTIRLIDYKNQTVIIKNRSGNSFIISLLDCIDLFTHRHEKEEKYDFTKLKPFTPVLARTGDHQTWFPHFFESYHPQNHGGEFYMIDDQHSSHRYSQCVPYEGNEHLFRTQDPIPEKYKL